MALSLSLAMSSLVWAQPPNDGAKLLTLSDLYAEGTYNTEAYVCSRRFPDGKDGWTASLSAWKTRNAAALADVRELDTQLSAAALSAPAAAGLTQEDLLALRTFGTVRMLAALAEVQDPQARELCDQLRGRLDKDDAQTQASIDQARAAARELLKRVKSPARP